MFGFELLEDEAYWRQDTVYTDGNFIGGVWVSGEATTTYEELQGISEPYTKGESSVILPEGVRNSESFFLYTEEDLFVHNDLDGTARTADIVYLQDPEVVSTAKPYVVFDKEAWRKNTGFTLLSEDYGLYLLIRQDKLPT